MDTSFSIRKVIKSSWGILKKNFWLLNGLMLVYTIVYILLFIPYIHSMIVFNQAPETFSLPEFVAMRITAVISYSVLSLFSLLFFPGYSKLTLQAVDGETPKLLSFFPSLIKIIYYIFAYIIFSIILTIGLIFCIIPGIYLIGRFSFFVFYILDQGCSPVNALKKSWKDTEGMGTKLFFFTLVLILFNIVGVLLLVVGSVITASLSSISVAYIYRKYLCVQKEHKTLNQDILV